ncbi:hypothetical protein [Endozoicomonas numazuensis]|uniref:Uncharacterized protein n=1 Tax=Endozoicomonas numazuensis TaxID=1137799 RepID=A0A081NL61_9GAMM|nr:hypothetical protein [Endozoicomonas numazuensis]KEQ19184.1 hypothetical protein GZ78_04100 [Endozoicomonas numazuensis]
MSLLDWINPFSKVIDLASEAITDQDKLNAFKHEADMASAELRQMLEETYRQELQTTTVPWVDALHKMGRQVMSYLGYGLAFYMVHQGYDPMAAMAALAPGGIYNYVKGRGK